MSGLVYVDDLEPVNSEELEAVWLLVSGLFGDPDPRVEITGAYFGERRYPHTIYESEENRFRVGVCIPKHQADNPLARLVNLSHELVHCLSPNGWPPKATVLEEGLAEHAKIYLARACFRDEYPDFDFRDMTSGAYRAAYDDIERLVDYEGLDGMREGVRTVRAATGLPFCQITEDDLATVFLRTPRSLLEHLSKPFID